MYYRDITGSFFNKCKCQTFIDWWLFCLMRSDKCAKLMILRRWTIITKKASNINCTYHFLSWNANGNVRTAGNSCTVFFRNLQVICFDQQTLNANNQIIRIPRFWLANRIRSVRLSGDHLMFPIVWFLFLSF